MSSTQRSQLEDAQRSVAQDTCIIVSIPQDGLTSQLSSSVVQGQTVDLTPLGDVEEVRPILSLSS